MSWQEHPLDLVSVLPYILIGVVIVACVAFLWIWATQRALDRTNDYTMLAASSPACYKDLNSNK